MKRKLSTLMNNHRDGKPTKGIVVDDYNDMICLNFDIGHLDFDEPFIGDVIVSGKIAILEINQELFDLCLFDCKIGKLVINKPIKALEVETLFFNEGHFGDRVSYINELNVKSGVKVNIRDISTGEIIGDIRDNLDCIPAKEYVVDGKVVEVNGNDFNET